MTDKTITILEDDTLQTPAEEPTADATAETETETETEEAPTEPTAQDASPSEELEQLRTANAEMVEQVKRTSAEFQNFRRRQEEEAKRVKVRIREDIIRSMLPILDHLDRTIAAAEQGGDGALESLLKGVELIEKTFTKFLKTTDWQSSRLREKSSTLPYTRP